MTSYSTYCAGRIRFVDGNLTCEDDERREEERDQLINCIASGAARALLDCAQDLDGRDADVYAEQWHSEEEGWELQALDDNARAKVLDVVGRFVDANVPYILILAHHIAWRSQSIRSGDSDVWSGDLSMAIYRVGNLLGYQCSGAGIDLDEYAIESGRRLRGWIEATVGYAFESPFINSSEEPCLLHIDV